MFHLRCNWKTNSRVLLDCDQVPVHTIGELLSLNAGRSLTYLLTSTNEIFCEKKKIKKASSDVRLKCLCYMSLAQISKLLKNEKKCVTEDP